MTDSDPMTTAVLLERTSRLLGSDAHISGLKPVQWETLRYLDRANRFSRTASAVTAYLGLTKGTVSQTIKALESRELLSKDSDPQDRRRIYLVLTSAGKRLLDDDPLRETASFIAGLSTAAREGLKLGLTELLKARLEGQGRRPLGICRDCRYFASNHANGRPHFCSLLEVPLEESDAHLICHEQLPVE